jgi:hypothetical protein
VIGNTEAAAPSLRVREPLRPYLNLNPDLAIAPPRTMLRSEGNAGCVGERSRAWAST